MESIIDILHKGGYSCVMKNREEVRTFTQRGVADLYDLYQADSAFMKGATIADKVIGKGRALKKFPTCNKSLPNTQKIDCESFFFGFPIYFYFSAFVPPMQPSIFFFDGCLAKNGFSACFS